ncbi:hypothetical protein AOR13_1226 [Alteromonas stellipolaris LMG 21856]|nr:hypothetical protein AOR13_1226 [Alteromonas stellipolaris LMG 21856]
MTMATFPMVFKLESFYKLRLINVHKIHSHFELLTLLPLDGCYSKG